MSSQPGPSQGGTNNGTLVTLDNIFSDIITSNHPIALNHTLRNCAPKDIRDTILASTLSNGQDPLSVLDVRSNTIGILYILSARLHSSSTSPPALSFIEAFCHDFDPELARYAPDRVSSVAKGIIRLAEAMHNIKYAIQPLYDLLTRYPPSLSCLTTLHPLFISACVQTQHFSLALPILLTPITTISITLSPDLHYNDNLVYHYAGGIALAALKRWGEAEEFFELVVSAPGQLPSALQLEALKKLVLVQLIAKGKTTSPPKYTNPVLLRLLKSTPYAGLVNAYPQQINNLRGIAKKEQDFFATERNTGLVQQAIDRAPRWSIKKLTATYLTLGLSEIGKTVGIESEEEVRKVVLDMIACSEITAQISVSGTVTFSDPPSQSQYTKADVDRVLRESEEQASLLKRLEMEMARSREYLSKAVRSKEESAWGSSMDEELMFAADRAGMSISGGAFAEDTMFS
ncbi:hypothetical protein PILCRDRAFT_815352 [Piloderma croceum F 1598]|uniref:COP9 signalosome complex subunit 3 n=1 Tax=Piloderma croceum (strain F 1598) TaxID=765440 RepID=A0A0C3FS58_PILCF|nr:hypothetical protein PILCRDRAFT_815352 [Piloderma croceum F 1598]